MKKINYLLMLLLFTLFIPRVSALSFDMGTQLYNSSSADKSLYEIKVSLKNITDTSYGVASCIMKIQLEGDVQLNTKVRTLGNWTMTSGEIYLFDTGNPALENTDFFVIPVKASGSGTVTLDDIECSDGETSVFIAKKTVSLNYTSEQSNNNNNNNNGNNNASNNNNVNNNNNKDNNKNNDSSTVKDSNCDLSNIILSEGIIEFDSNVNEYDISVSDLSKLEVTPELASDKASFTVNKYEDRVVIEVTAEDSSLKVYTLYVEELSLEEVKEEKTNYAPIFIGIICVLVLINIFRIVKNNKNKS